MSHHCNYCNLYFTSLPAFYRHRVGSGEGRRCMNENEMFMDGLRVGEHFTARLTDAVDASSGSLESNTHHLITEPTERHRAEYEKKESIAAAHARWAFNRGINPDRLIRAGLPASTVIKVVDDEVKKIKDQT